MISARERPIKIRRISIRNYKGIDKLDMKFPVPRLPDDLDIFVMGSRNGLGKTSVIECCALLLLVPMLKDVISLRDRYWIVDVPDLLVRAGEDSAEIDGEIMLEDEAFTLKMQIDRRGIVEASCEKLFESMQENRWVYREREAHDLIMAICGYTRTLSLKACSCYFTVIERCKRVIRKWE